jgi:hypothetical protein
VDLGDVLVKIRYSKVILDLKSIIKRENGAQEKSGDLLKLAVWDRYGKLLYVGEAAPIAFDPSRESLNLVLPRGVWKLRVSLVRQNRTVTFSDLQIRVSSLDCQKLRMLHGKQYQEGCAENARFFGSGGQSKGRRIATD